MKKVTWGIVAAGLVLLPVALLGRGAVGPAPREGGDLEAVRVSRRDIHTRVKATGLIRLMTGAEVRVGSRASGVVERLKVRVGDRVEKGQLLAVLDDQELVARRDQATAALDAAEAQLAFARSDLKRRHELSTFQLIAPGDLDLAERAFAVAEQQRAEAEATLTLARTQLDYSRIHSPISGVVGSVSTQEGETVSASLAAPTFVTLLDLERLEVWAYVDETDIGRIRLGQKATFTVDTYPDESFEGRVTAIYPQAEIRDNVVNYVTVVRFSPPPHHTLRPEMTAMVQIAIQSRDDVLAVPRGAVRRGPEGTFVYGPGEAGLVECPVVTGLRDDRYWEIVEGLDEGDTILVGRLSADATRRP
jgi:macrolide-specific efflux system membrane fusion protein